MGINARYSGYRRRGAILPFIAVCMLVIVAFLGFSIDVTRDMIAVRKSQFAADSAARYAYSMAANVDGSYPSTSQAVAANIAAALSEPNGNGPNSTAAWNDAPSGPTNDTGPWTSGVTFTADDVQLVANPVDANEQLLQLTVRRQNTDALRQIFMPAIYAADATLSKNPPNQTAEVVRTIEVVGQPASRIGPAVPRSAFSSTALTGFACFPLALSNAQFTAAASSNATTTKYTIDLVSSQSASTPALAGHIKACLINDALSGTTGSGSYYGPSQGNPAIDQLIGLLKYFNGQADATAITPAAVERGVSVGAFDPADPTFQSRKQSVLSALAQVKPGQYLILPVISTDPVFGGGAPNQVVGFARMQVAQMVTPAPPAVPSNFAILLNIGQSVVMRNTTASPVATIPTFTSALMTAPISPFTARTYDPATNSISLRPRGVVLAPAVSPRL